MINIFSKASLLGMTLLLAAGCSTPASLKPIKPPILLEGLKVDDILNTNSRSVIAFESLMNDLSAIRVIYLGETHTSIEDHRIQQKILEGLYARNPKLTLAMEMFPRETQPILDRYSRGLLSQEAFIKEVNWDGVWGFPFELYRPMLTFAQEKQLQILALNAPRHVVGKIAVSGLASLSPEERSRVASDFHKDDSKHREYVRQEYELHLKGGIKDFETFFEAQLAWEETMAETLADRLSQLPEGEQIVVLVGKGHIVNRVGIPSLTFLRAPASFKTVVPLPVNYPDSLYDPDLADYVWITEPLEPTAHRPRLGVMIVPAPSGTGLEVKGIAPGSPAEKAGIQKGDILFEIDGIPLKSVEDLHKALGKDSPDHTLGIKRGKRQLTVPVTISP